MLNQVMLNSVYNIQFDEMIIRLRDQNSRPLDVEDKCYMALLVNK